MKEDEAETPRVAGPLAARARAVIPGGVNSAQRQFPGVEDLVIVSSSGSTLTDAAGRTYTDYHAAYGPPVLGHNDPDVNRAAAAAARRLDHPGLGVTPYEIELSERLVDMVPSVEKVLLTTSGTEATFHAVRVARAATARRYLVKFQGCYHGWHDAVAMNVISPPDRLGCKDPISDGILPEVLDSTIVVPFNDSEAVERTFESYEGRLAAVILEPLVHTIGCILPLPGFLRRLRELCTAHGTVLVFDEVITGFRHGMGGYQALAGVTPDLTTLGKSMSNGYPIAALGGRTDLMDLFSTTPGRPAFFGGTFNGHPATVAAALATLDKLENEPVHDHIFRLGKRARQGLRDLWESLDVDAVVTGFGSTFVTYFMRPPVEQYADLLRNDADLFTGYRLELLRHGILETPLNLKRSYLSYAHDEADVDTLIEATGEAVVKILSRRSA